MNNQTQKKKTEELQELACKVGHANPRTTTSVYLHSNKEITAKTKEEIGQNIGVSDIKSV